MDFIDLKTQYHKLRKPINERIQTVLDHGQYILGAEVGELEQKLADYVGVRHCIVVASGTDALLMALMAFDIGPGDEVITSPFTFIATAEVIALLGATPIFVDIDPNTYNLNPRLLEAAIGSRTKAIMPVSLYGQCADMDTINAIAARHSVPVIEDAAQSFGATYKGRKSCALSLIGATSFFPSKPLGCYGDGGALFTDDSGLAKLINGLRVHGQDGRYRHPRIGINGRMDTIQAAVLLAKLETFDREVKSRDRLGKAYSRLIGDAFHDADPARSMTTPYVEPHNRSVYAQYTIEVSDRDRVQANMKSRGIPTAVHYPLPLHRQPVFSDLGLDRGSFPDSERAAERVISLPMHPYLSEDQQREVVAVLREAVSG